MPVDAAGELDEEAGDELTETLIARFRETDEASVADENSFWSVTAEELGYGITA